jgi:hypothetical protein
MIKFYPKGMSHPGAKRKNSWENCEDRKQIKGRPRRSALFEFYEQTRLEAKFGTQLRDSPGSSAGDTAKVTRVDVPTRLVELRVVEQVECFDAKLHIHTLSQLRVFLQ